MAKKDTNGKGTSKNPVEMARKAALGVQLKKSRRKAAMEPIKGRFDVNAFYMEKKDKVNKASLAYIQARWTFIKASLEGHPDLQKVWIQRQLDIHGNNPLATAWLMEIELSI